MTWEQLAKEIVDHIVPPMREHVARKLDERADLLREYTRTAVREAIEAERKRNRKALSEVTRALDELDARTKRADAGVVDLGQRRAR
jgi:hypothetical protein